MAPQEPLRQNKMAYQADEMFRGHPGRDPGRFYKLSQILEARELWRLIYSSFSPKFYIPTN